MRNEKCKKISYKIVVFDDGRWTLEDGKGNEMKESVELREYQDEDGNFKGINEKRVFVEYTRNSPTLVCRGNYCRWVK
jgi:hypothetical protein